MSTRKANVGGHEFTVAAVETHRDGYWIRSALPERDPDWTYADAAGHTHRAVTDAAGTVSHPSLEWIVTSEETEEWSEMGYWSCPHCGVRIQPGTRAFRPRFVPTEHLISITVHGDESTLRPLFHAGELVPVEVEGHSLLLLPSEIVSHLWPNDGWAEATFIGAIDHA